MDELFTGEQLVFCHDRDTGLRAVIAVDDTRLGPALGGVRMQPYANGLAAATEAHRLAAGMTLKNAAAGLPLGGGKSVIIADRALDPTERERVMRSFGTFVAGLGGKYIPAVDMGTGIADLATVATGGARVACDASDPSPWTALGVCEGIRAAVAHTYVSHTLDGLRVVIQGAGHVGAELARLLADEGAHVLIADIDADRARAVAAAVGGEQIDANRALEMHCDVLAPCSVARVVDAETAHNLGCRILAGAANDQLANSATAHVLADAGVLYVPDFLINAGGVIQVYGTIENWTDDHVHTEVTRIGDRVAAVLDEAARDGILSLEAAIAHATRRLTARTLAPA